MDKLSSVNINKVEKLNINIETQAKEKLLQDNPELSSNIELSGVIYIKDELGGIVKIGNKKFPFIGGQIIKKAKKKNESFRIFNTIIVENLGGDIGAFVMCETDDGIEFGVASLGKEGNIIEKITYKKKNYEICEANLFLDGTGDLKLKLIDENSKKEEYLYIHQIPLFDIYAYHMTYILSSKK